MALTSPKDTMSLLKPGYLTPFRRSLISFSVMNRGLGGNFARLLWFPMLRKSAMLAGTLRDVGHWLMSNGPAPSHVGGRASLQETLTVFREDGCLLRTLTTPQDRR